MESEDIIKWVKWGFFGLIALAIILGGWFTVDAGEVGVTFNKATGTTKSFQQGMYFKLPILTDVTKFDVKTQKEDIKAGSASKDMQKVEVHVVVNYHLDYTQVNNLYVKVGEDYVQKIIIPAVSESVKASTALFNVEQIIEQREKLKTSVETALKTRLIAYNIVLESVNLVNIDFDKNFNETVEQKQIEEQKVKTAEYLRQQAEKNKQTTILEAQAEAEKQRLLSMSATKDVIELKRIEKWDGHYPSTYVAGSGQGLIINPTK